MTQIQKAANDLRNKREKQLVELRTEIAQDIVNLMQDHGMESHEDFFGDFFNCGGGCYAVFKLHKVFVENGQLKMVVEFECSEPQTFDMSDIVVNTTETMLNIYAQIAEAIDKK